MKKYLLSTLAIAGLLTLNSTAKAEDNFMGMGMSDAYAVMQAGFGFGQKDYKESGVVALGAGYHLNSYLKSDLTVGFRGFGKLEQKKEHRKVDAWAIPVLMNVYASIPYKNMSVYAMGGLGMSYNMLDNDKEIRGDDKMNFAWTVGGGIGYKLTECWGLDLGYRYVDLGEGRSKLKDRDVRMKQNMRSHDVLLSARYYF